MIIINTWFCEKFDKDSIKIKSISSTYSFFILFEVFVYLLDKSIESHNSKMKQKRNRWNEIFYFPHNWSNYDKSQDISTASIVH